MINTNNHSVNIPMSEYKELLEYAKLSGLKKIEKGEPVYNAVQNYLVNQPGPTGVDMDKIEIYVKIKI